MSCAAQTAHSALPSLAPFATVAVCLAARFVTRSISALNEKRSARNAARAPAIVAATPRIAPPPSGALPALV